MGSDSQKALDLLIVGRYISNGAVEKAMADLSRLATVRDGYYKATAHGYDPAKMEFHTGGLTPAELAAGEAKIAAAEATAAKIAAIQAREAAQYQAHYDQVLAAAESAAAARVAAEEAAAEEIIAIQRQQFTEYQAILAEAESAQAQRVAAEEAQVAARAAVMDDETAQIQAAYQERIAAHLAFTEEQLAIDQAQLAEDETRIATWLVQQEEAELQRAQIVAAAAARTQAIQTETLAMQLEQEGEAQAASIVRLESYYARRRALAATDGEVEALNAQEGAARAGIEAGPAGGAGGGLIGRLGQLYLIHQAITGAANAYHAFMADMAAGKLVNGKGTDGKLDEGNIEEAMKKYAEAKKEREQGVIGIVIGFGTSIRNFFTGEQDDIDKATEAVERNNKAWEKAEKNRKAGQKYTAEIHKEITDRNLDIRSVGVFGFNKERLDEDKRYQEEEQKLVDRANDLQRETGKNLTAAQKKEFEERWELAEDFHRRMAALTDATELREHLKATEEMNRAISLSAGSMQEARATRSGDFERAARIRLGVELAAKREDLRHKEDEEDRLAKDAEGKTTRTIKEQATIEALRKSQRDALSGEYDEKGIDAAFQAREQAIAHQQSVEEAIRSAELNHAQEIIRLKLLEGQYVSKQERDDLKRLEIADQYEKKLESIWALMRDPSNKDQMDTLRKREQGLLSDQDRALADVGKGLYTAKGWNAGNNLTGSYSGLNEGFSSENLPKQTAENTSRTAKAVEALNGTLRAWMQGQNANGDAPIYSVGFGH